MSKKTRKLAINSFLAITAMAWSAQSLGGGSGSDNRQPLASSGSLSSPVVTPVSRSPGNLPKQEE